MNEQPNIPYYYNKEKLINLKEQLETAWSIHLKNIPTDTDGKERTLMAEFFGHMSAMIDSLTNKYE